MQLEWRPVAGYEGRYEVANDGRVRSVPRTVNGGFAGVRSITGRELLQHGDQQAVVLLSCNRKLARLLVAALVLTAFVGPGTTPRHRDGNTWNNRLTNLEWNE